ncbi:MAG: peptidoglycan DD-metalloendopeptidase family protein [Mariprofundaceae bacterium]
MVAFLLPGLLLMMIGLAPATVDASTATRLQEIKQERIRLQEIREKLESQLGALGRELRQLDKKLVAASQASKKAGADVAVAKSRLAELNSEQRRLQRQVDALRARMQTQVAAAYQRAGSNSLLALAAHSESVAEMPHRRYLLASIMQAQERDRKAYLDSLEALMTVLAEAQKQLAALQLLQQAQREKKAELRLRVDAKRTMWRNIKRDASLRQQRDAALAKQEQALVDLLNGMSTSLSDADFSVVRKTLRQRKGKIPWPLDGKVVASYRSRVAPGRPRLAGVQLAPRHDDSRVTAVGAGRVRFADWFGGYGLMMIVDHGDGMMSVYAHNDALFKQVGDWVDDREILADAGSTGWVESVRLYFELRDKGRTVNPKRWCRK